MFAPLNINVEGRVVGPHSTASVPDEASIILPSSTATDEGTAGGRIYASTNAASRKFAGAWSVDLKERKIRVSASAPVPLTPGNRQWRNGRGDICWRRLMRSSPPSSSKYRSEEIIHQGRFARADIDDGSGTLRQGWFDQSQRHDKVRLIPAHRIGGPGVLHVFPMFPARY